LAIEALQFIDIALKDLFGARNAIVMGIWQDLVDKHG